MISSGWSLVRSKEVCCVVQSMFELLLYERIVASHYNLPSSSSRSCCWSYFHFFFSSPCCNSLQVHWLNHNFPCLQFMHKNLAWKCVLVSGHGALIECKVGVLQDHWESFFIHVSPQIVYLPRLCVERPYQAIGYCHVETRLLRDVLRRNWFPLQVSDFDVLLTSTWI